MVDRYTKAVLTVIAAALVVLAGQGFVGPLGAQIVREPQKVQICDSVSCVAIDGFGSNGSLRVSPR